MMEPGSRGGHHHLVARKKRTRSMFSERGRSAPHALKLTELMLLVVSGVFLPQILNCLDHPQYWWVTQLNFVFLSSPVVPVGQTSFVSIVGPSLSGGKSATRPTAWTT